MFARVSRRYDLANRAMTFGMDVLWRKKLVDKLLDGNPSGKKVLDAACGSGDVALEIARKFPGAEITATDFCEEMLEMAKLKLSGFPSAKLECADCSSLPFEDETFDAATMAFGFRNFKDRPACLRELFRVMKKNSKIRMLETSRAGFPLEGIQNFFMEKIAPTAASLCGGNRLDYEYLAKTTREYPEPQEVENMFREAGFLNVKTKRLGFGMVAIVSAEKIF